MTSSPTSTCRRTSIICLSLAAAQRAVESDSLLAEARALHGYEFAATTWDLRRRVAPRWSTRCR